MAAPNNAVGPDAFAECLQPSQTPAAPKDPAAAIPLVAVVATRPETVLQDVQRAMELAGVSHHLEPTAATLLKINISWQHW